MEEWAYVKKTESVVVYADARLRSFDDVLKVLVPERHTVVLLYVEANEADKAYELQALLRVMDTGSTAHFSDRLLILSCAKDDSGQEAFVEAMKAHVDAVFGQGMALSEARRVMTGGGTIAPDIDAIFESERSLLEKYGRL